MVHRPNPARHALTGLALAGPFPTARQALAQPQLAKERNCLACHPTDRKVVDPAPREVAPRYAGQSDAVVKLSAKVVRGGSGAWGGVPMPARPQVSDAEARQLVQCTLTLR